MHLWKHKKRTIKSIVNAKNDIINWNLAKISQLSHIYGVSKSSKSSSWRFLMPFLKLKMAGLHLSGDLKWDEWSTDLAFPAEPPPPFQHTLSSSDLLLVHDWFTCSSCSYCSERIFLVSTRMKLVVQRLWSYLTL